MASKNQHKTEQRQTKGSMKRCGSGIFEHTESDLERKKDIDQKEE